MKWLKRISKFILSKEIKEANRKYTLAMRWVTKLENAVVDEDKETLLQAMYHVSKRRNQELKFEWGEARQLTTEPFPSYEVPIEISLQK